jgi:D-alanyl-D-alanine carboxypeptidase/Putative peptidoglycan binding domain
MVLSLLERGSIGAAVERWQNFLIGQDILKDVADGRFGQNTHDATKAYQSLKGLPSDGRVGAKTYAKALEDGFDGVALDPDFPPKPSFPALIGTLDRQAVFGKFDYRDNPKPGNAEAIDILPTWEGANIIKVELPNFQTITSAPSSGKMTFHRLAAPQLAGLWKAWQAKDLLSLILTFDGSFVPRYIRGSRTVLSNHAFGSAFDINYQWNKLGSTPALVGTKGSVRLLVPIANDYGFYWGGHFNSRKDGMHFEVAKILSSSDLQALAQKYGI